MAVTFREVIQSEKPVLVDFFAIWCESCKMMTPILQEVKKEIGENASVIKIDIGKQPQIAQTLSIQGVPTLIIFQKGESKWRQSSVVPAKELLRLLKAFITSS